MLHIMDQEFDHPLTYFYKTDLGPCLNLPELAKSHDRVCWCRLEHVYAFRSRALVGLLWVPF